MLSCRESPEREFAAVDDEQEAEGDDDRDAAQDFDPRAAARCETIADQVDPDMRIGDVGGAEAEHHERQEEVPLEFL